MAGAGSRAIVTSRSSGGGALITVEIKNLNTIMRKLSPERFIKTFNQKMNIYLRSFAYKLTRRIYETLYSGKLADLKYVQPLVKGHSVTLIETRNLVDRGIGWKFIKSGAGASVGIEIGARDGTHAPSGLSYRRFIELISKGTSFKPSVAQRRALSEKLYRATGERTHGMQQRWVIPPRPFLNEALHRPATRNDFRRTVEKAANETIRALQR
jgi:hypothetical protein